MQAMRGKLRFFVLMYEPGAKKSFFGGDNVSECQLQTMEKWWHSRKRM